MLHPRRGPIPTCDSIERGSPISRRIRTRIERRTPRGFHSVPGLQWTFLAGTKGRLRVIPRVCTREVSGTKLRRPACARSACGGGPLGGSFGADVSRYRAVCVRRSSRPPKSLPRQAEPAAQNPVVCKKADADEGSNACGRRGRCNSRGEGTSTRTRTWQAFEREPTCAGSVKVEQAPALDDGAFRHRRVHGHGRSGSSRAPRDEGTEVCGCMMTITPGRRRRASVSAGGPSANFALVGRRSRNDFTVSVGRADRRFAAGARSSTEVRVGRLSHIWVRTKPHPYRTSLHYKLPWLRFTWGTVSHPL